MEYIYPAIFHRNSDGSFTITYPDLPGCISEGKTLSNAMHMAESALTQWIEYLADKGEEIPPASDIMELSVEDDEFTTLVQAKTALIAM